MYNLKSRIDANLKHKTKNTILLIDFKSNCIRNLIEFKSNCIRNLIEFKSNCIRN